MTSVYEKVCSILKTGNKEITSTQISKEMDIPAEDISIILQTLCEMKKFPGANICYEKHTKLNALKFD